MHEAITPAVMVPMVSTWFEGDHICISLYEQNIRDGSFGEVILELRDQEAWCAIFDGEIDLANPLGSMIDLAADCGYLATRTSGALLH